METPNPNSNSGPSAPKSQVITRFDAFPLNKKVLRAVQALKFESPTPVQAAAMPIALERTDLIGLAETGSGKTAAFSIPMLEILLSQPESKALILAPTRELAIQIMDFLRLLTRDTPQIKMALLVGGADMRRQVQALKKKPQILVATPGRLNDHLDKRWSLLKEVNYFVLDEGDRMLDMGFAPQIDNIIDHLPKKRQTLLFTATMAPKTKKLAEKLLYQPKTVSIGPQSQPVKTVKQQVIRTTMQAKKDLLLDELNQRDGSIIIFTRTKVRTDRLARYLGSFGHSVISIHGGRTQGQRNHALKGFRDQTYRILVATDVAARGLDIPQVQHVINYDLPREEEDYVHRVGRTARAGREGEALTILLPDDVRAWKKLVARYQIQATGDPSLVKEIDGSKFEKVRSQPKKKSRSREFSKGDSKKPGRRPKRNDRSSEKRDFKSIKKESFKKSPESEELDQPRRFKKPLRGKKPFRSKNSAQDKKRSDSSRGKKRPSPDRPSNESKKGRAKKKGPFPSRKKASPGKKPSDQRPRKPIRTTKKA